MNLGLGLRFLKLGDRSPQVLQTVWNKKMQKHVLDIFVRTTHAALAKHNCGAYAIWSCMRLRMQKTPTIAFPGRYAAAVYGPQSAVFVAGAATCEPQSVLTGVCVCVCAFKSVLSNTCTLMCELSYVCNICALSHVRSHPCSHIPCALIGVLYLCSQVRALECRCSICHPSLVLLNPV